MERRSLTVVETQPIDGRAVRTLDVERFLIWVYKLQLAHLVVGWGADLERAEAEASGIAVHGVSRDGIVAVAKAMDCGAVVSSSRSSAQSGDLHPDAEEAHRIVKLLPSRAGTLLVRCAVKAARPVWLPDGATKLVPLWKSEPRYDHRQMPIKGSFVIRHAGNDRNRNAIEPYCVLEVLNPVELIAASREMFGYWHHALSILAEYLSASTLTAHRVLPPPFSATPWTETKPETISRVSPRAS